MVDIIVLYVVNESVMQFYVIDILVLNIFITYGIKIDELNQKS